MGIEERVVASAEDILKQTPGGLTKEALVRMIGPRLPNKLLPAKIIEILRKQPQRASFRSSCRLSFNRHRGRP